MKPGDIPEEGIRLNKYIAHCGLASRRGAADLIKAGHVQVDGKAVTDIGYRVRPGEKVTYKGRHVTPATEKVYILLNKPKDYITTVRDERGRKTVMDLVQHKVDQRVYPVGRLDRMTTGLLLLTNDGDLAKKLSHPRYEVQKVYHVELDKNVKPSDLEILRKGITLDDGTIRVDAINYVYGKSHREVALELHSGKNRVIRRMFEKLDYRVRKLDRVYYAGLTKKDLPRGRCRPLTKREVIMLKHFS